MGLELLRDVPISRILRKNIDAPMFDWTVSVASRRTTTEVLGFFLVISKLGRGKTYTDDHNCKRATRIKHGIFWQSMIGLICLISMSLRHIQNSPIQSRKTHSFYKKSVKSNFKIRFWKKILCWPFRDCKVHMFPWSCKAGESYNSTNIVPIPDLVR